MLASTSSVARGTPDAPPTRDNVVGLRRQLTAPPPLARTMNLPCQHHDPGLWFSSSPADLNQAKAYCRGCWNRQSCLAGAVERAEPAGVWGGEIFDEGRILAFKRPRGRPRKAVGSAQPA